MIEMLQYGFMQRAFITGILLAVITPLIGITIVLKRMSMIGDALSHASLAGVALGLLLGINPILGAMGICLFAALGVEAIRRKIPRYSEMAICIIMSTGIGLAGVLSGFVKNGTNFNSFLFGSIIDQQRRTTDRMRDQCLSITLCITFIQRTILHWI
jgi:zinc transport system permease protein